MQHSAIGCQQIEISCQQNVIGCIKGKIIPTVFESTKTTLVETRTEENVRRSIRQRGFPTRLQDSELFQDKKINDDGDFIHFVLIVESEPVKMKDALSDPKWICDVKEKLKLIEKNKTWELVDLPEGMKPVDVRWVYEVKENPNGEIINHKARLVANGFL